ncbi:FtsX-like permease family protein [Micromonospora sp. SH-82]|uniref:FtsX-like permease family protein n=1 Tax=Micromonospora sp. SH-82 TaxID=3132938 RepID=UPI003EBF5D17
MTVHETLRRIRSHRATFLLLTVLTVLVAGLVEGVPRITGRLTEQGLHHHVADRPAVLRDLVYDADPAGYVDATGPVAARRAELDRLTERMPAPVRAVVARRWYLAEAAPGRLTGADLAARNLLVDLRLRTSPGAAEAGTLVDGDWPTDEPPAAGPIPLALAADVAAGLNLRVGSRLDLAALRPGDGAEPVELMVVGVFRPTDPADGIWAGLPPVLRVVEPEGDGKPFNAVGLVGAGALDARAAEGWPLRFSWRYRVDADRLAPGDLDATVDGLTGMQRDVVPGVRFTQGLDLPLREFAASVSAARTLLAVVAAGVLGTLAGLVLLVTGLAVRARREEFALIRARGGGRSSPALHCLAESALVVLPAVVVGWSLGRLVPGDAAGTGWLLVAVAVGVTAALPVAALAVPDGTTGRRDTVRWGTGPRRLTVEVLLLVSAALGVVLLHRRGLTPGAVDPLLVSVPVLVAVAAATVALRAYPWPLRLLGRVAAGTRGGVAFLGAARAGRSGVTSPLVVVVVAVATAAFCAVVAAGIEAGRDRSTSRAVPADALVDGYRLTPETGDELARLPGVRAVTPVADEADATLSRDALGTDAGLGDVTVLVVDGPGLADVAGRAGRDVAVPRVLSGGTDPAGPAPAVVSPALAGELAEAGLDRSAFVEFQGRRYEFRVADTAGDFPLLRPGTDRFLVLPWQALPTRVYPAVPTGFLIAGADLDVAAVQRVGDEGQRRFQSGGALAAAGGPLPVTVSTWADLRAQHGTGGANGVLAFGFLAGAVGGAGLALLAVALTVLAGARDRAQTVFRLRTLGLSRGQWRGLLLIELAPLTGVAVLTGALVGALLPVLLAPTLGLRAFTGGTPVTVTFDPALVAGVFGLGGLALALALAVEMLNNRRSRLGDALRIDRGESR